MSDTPRMNSATTSNERYRVGCELERELAAIVPRLNAEWQARLEAMTLERDALKATCEDYRIQACMPDDCRIKAERDILAAKAKRADEAEAALSAMVHTNARMNGEHIAELRAERARAEKAEAVPCTGWLADESKGE